MKGVGQTIVIPLWVVPPDQLIPPGPGAESDPAQPEHTATSHDRLTFCSHHVRQASPSLS